MVQKTLVKKEKAKYNPTRRRSVELRRIYKLFKAGMIDLNTYLNRRKKIFAKYNGEIKNGKIVK